MPDYAGIDLPKERRDITPELLREHLRTCPCSFRLRFDSLDAAIKYEAPEYCREDEAVPIYSCFIPARPYGIPVPGEPSLLPANVVFLSPDEFAIKGVALFRENTCIQEINFSSTTATVRPR